MTDEQESKTVVADGGSTPRNAVRWERLGIRLILVGILIASVVALTALLAGSSFTIGYGIGIVVALTGLLITVVSGAQDLGTVYGLGLLVAVFGVLLAGYGFEQGTLFPLIFGVVATLLGIGTGVYTVRD